MNEPSAPGTPSTTPNADVPAKYVIPPTLGEVITSVDTRNSYEMREQIGDGYFGLVFACSDQWGNDLAAKVLKASSSYEVVRAAAQAEMLKLVRMRHPNVTYIYDAFEYRDTFYIITERCDFPLSHLFQASYRTPYWLEGVARCLLQAVHYLHVSQYAHQDIHLGNVLIASSKDQMDPNTRATTFKLGDLGVSRVFGELDAANTLNDAIKPPEARDPKEFGPLDHRIDIYQTGLLLLQLARSEQMVFTPDEIVRGRPRELALELPPPLNTALEKTLRRHVMHRTDDAIELWRDLNSPPGIRSAALKLAPLPPT